MGRNGANEDAGAPVRTETAPAGLLLTPGASGNRDHATLIAIEQGLPEMTVDRLTLGTTSVPSAIKKIGAAVSDLAARLSVEPERIALGGRSFGGRASSVAVAEGLPAHSLVLLSYPLHPPGKPDKLRVDHFPDLVAPALFVSGTKDPFGTPEEFEQHVGAIAGPIRTEWIPGNHSPKGQDDEIVSLIRSWWGLE